MSDVVTYYDKVNREGSERTVFTAFGCIGLNINQKLDVFVELRAGDTAL